MRVVYLVGPYRAATEYGVYTNIARASELALEIWRAGAACICPHKNTAFFGGAAPDSVWLEGDKEIVRRCDAVFLGSDWSESEGARAECDLAKQIGLPLFDDIAALRRWVDGQ